VTIKPQFLTQISSIAFNFHLLAVKMTDKPYRMSNILGFTLRPYLHPHIKPTHRNAYIAFFHATSATCLHAKTTNDGLWSSLSYQRRLKALRNQRPVDEDHGAFPSILYPRIEDANATAPCISGTAKFQRPSDIAIPTLVQLPTSLAVFRKKYNHIKPGANSPDNTTLYGTIYHNLTFF
jgi:hypothetical protein